MPTGKQRADRSNSAQGTDPKKKKIIKTKSGGNASVSQKTVDDAKANKGVFKERPKYKGKVIKNKDGSMSGIKKHDGSYTRTTGPVARRKAAKDLEYDRRLHRKDSISHSQTIKTFQNAKKKG